MNEEAPDDLSPRAEIFRSKLIEDFQLIDMIANRGGVEPPKYYSNEITGIVTDQLTVFPCKLSRIFSYGISLKLPTIFGTGNDV